MLTEWIQEDLDKSGINKEIAQEMGIRPIKDHDDMIECVGLTKKDGQSILQMSPAYLIPYLCAYEKYGRIKLRYEIEGQKYISPIKNICENTQHLYFLKGDEEKLSRSHFPLVIVEGEKKSAKVAQELRKVGNFAVIGISGVEMWKACPEWDKITISCRDVYIVFDSDYRQKPNVQIALVKLFLFLKKKRGNVKVVSFDLKNKGIDDHLVSIEKAGRKPDEEMFSLLNEAKTDIWEDHINYYKLSEILAESKYSIDVDCKAIFEEYKLKAQYSISFSTFKNAVKKAYRDIFARELSSNEKRPVIKLDGGFMTENLRRIDEILTDTGKIFQQNGKLVRAVQEVEKMEDGTPTKTWVIRPIGAYYMMKLLSEEAVFLKESDGEWKKVDCPKVLAETVCGKEEWEVPYLTGIIAAPTLREDGSILDKPGYDTKTGLFFCNENTEFLPVPEFPTLEDAKAALERIKIPLAEFPFVSEKDRAVVVTMILTALIRKSLLTAPIFGFSAPKMATGKSFLPMLVVGTIATGSEVAPKNKPKTEEDAEKKYLSFLMTGSPIICLDNIYTPLSGECLCSILTSDKWEGGRLLGTNIMPKVSTRITWAVTGNNLSFKADISTRALLCSLDAQCERPGEREFKIDLRKWLPEHRSEIIRDALTILRAYHLADRPKPENIKQFGRFEQWSNWVRGAVMWVGMEDPCGTRDEIEQSDPVRITLKSLFFAWMRNVKQAVSARELVDIAKENRELSDALLGAAEKFIKGEMTSTNISCYLRSIKGRWEHGCCIKASGEDRTGSTIWKLECDVNADFSCLI